MTSDASIHRRLFCTMAQCGRSAAGIAEDIATRIAAGEPRISGVMIESHLEAGRQDLVPGQPLKRGVSITDACLGWAQTEPVLRSLAQAVRARSQRG